MNLIARLKAIFRKHPRKPTEEELRVVELAKVVIKLNGQQSALIKELLGNNQKLLDQNRELLAECQSWRAVMRAKL